MSEWDLQPEQSSQFGHFLAVLIQGQIEVHKASSKANVRTPYSREQLQLILEKTGWTTEFESLIDTRDLEDAGWEIGLCLSESPKDLAEIDIDPKLRSFLNSQLDVLRRFEGNREVRSRAVRKHDFRRFFCPYQFREGHIKTPFRARRADPAGSRPGR